ncbi:heavy-metal-associated domain-containing protein [Rhodobacter sp. SY28-1]|uniref:heavy-metal-associated domain-containing protein n=1 Tax=Rhodobacter sp. SY28-1 TaxID=2562317 RepID=UPI001F1004B5|nr:heavy-metal-associated domain-containing protein [Rhodobacter sp. SY28-1]
MLNLHIPNMNCGGCARSVTAAVRSVDAEAKVEPDLPARTIAVDTKLPEVTVREALAEAGFAAA